MMVPPISNQRKAKMGTVLMQMCHSLATMSCCERGMHAAIITDKNLQILSAGYNGPARRLFNGCKRPLVSGNCGCIHAEANAIAQLRGGDPWFIFCTGAPCEACAQLLVNIGIRVVVYGTPTNSFEEGGRQVFNESATFCERIDLVPSAIFRAP